METIYRKVAVSERKPKECWVLTPSGGILFIDNKWKCPHSGQEQVNSSFTHWLEEIPDNSPQIEKLEAEKKELLEALEKCNKFLYDFKQQSIDDAYKLQSETISLIQKHKQ